MLIDAAHPEQTRVAVVDGTRVEEFDFESQNKKQLRGNIYLAKVTRVEASLQAAFVDYGGNRHGFLAFSEIHPDYYQIPVEDRAKLIEAEAAAAAEDDEYEDEDSDTDNDSDEPQDAAAAEEAEIAAQEIRKREKRKSKNWRRYKIQEVIKHGQIMLVQVVKEERGTKGAALTTYMSLAGRYCVLMPNSAKGGGISRKISNAADRKRLKNITSELDIADGMGLIIRTAGAKRNKTEIKRDYDYLSRLWSTIREKTLKSSAPTLVHEEGGLVRRAVRDLYDKDIEEVLVEGDSAFEDAQGFMEMLMPTHKNRVKHYQEKYPIFLRYKVEDQLETIHSPEVQLKSGGYLVIHQTEALVAIDVNSGKATRERNIEATAVKTNLEAAEESCRQMRLRDLAGLIVIDFIDMEENKNNRAVEKRMKDSLKRDRARVQAGRISMFGLFEMSRQRRRASVIEGTSQVCPTCDGLGVIRSIESSALQALQALESEGMRKRSAKVKLTAPDSVALYILNEKRAQLSEIETNSNMHVVIETDEKMNPPQHEITVLEKLQKGERAQQAKSDEPSGRKRRRGRKPKKAAEEHAEEVIATQEVPAAADKETAKSDEDAPKRRRRGRRGGRSRGKPAEEVASQETSSTEAVVEETSVTREETSDRPKRRVRRSRKSAKSDVAPATETTEEGSDTTSETSQPAAEDKPKRPARTRRKRRTKAEPAASPEAEVKEAARSEPAEKASDEPSRPKRRVRRRATSKAVTPVETASVETAEEKPKSKRRTRKKATKPAAEPAREAPAVVEEIAVAKPKRTVRKRATASKSAENAEEVAIGQEKPVPKKRTRRKPAATAKATPAKAKAKPVEEKPEAAKKPVRKPRTRKTPAAKKAKATEKPAAEAKPETPAPAVREEKADAPAAKKTKRSWRSRIFGGEKD
jgi:ribonuclease E